MPIPPPGYVLLKKGDIIKKGDLIYDPDGKWSDAMIYGATVNLATFCRPATEEPQEKEWLNPWDNL